MRMISVVNEQGASIGGRRGPMHQAGALRTAYKRFANPAVYSGHPSSSNASPPIGETPP